MQMIPSSNVSPTSRGILPQPNLLLVNDVKEGRPPGPGVVLGRAGEVVDAADDACVDTLLAVLVVLVAELPGTRYNYQKFNRRDWKSQLCFSYFSVWCSWVTRYCVGVSLSFSSA